MVSFWPFKGDENSAASFEKILSQLSQRITEVSTQNDRYRLRRRKYKVLWSLYAVFGYMLLAAIFVLVIRYENWTAIEYTVVAGGPPFIYAIRVALDSYYAYRISNSRGHLDDLVKQREAAIERLKAATKYNSTQQLLEKYGGSPNPPNPQQKQGSQQQVRKRKSDIGPATRNAQQPGRTGFPPPPTANIPSRQPPGAPASRPHTSAGLPSRPSDTPPPSVNTPAQTGPGEEFAPNAFAAQPRPPPINRQPSQYATDGLKWYDRILDVMLGEDEGLAKNRIVLICEKCRLVNGQAPPGVRSVEEIGRWRCGGCHAWNGVESEEKRILHAISRTDGPISLSESTGPLPIQKSASRLPEHGSRSRGPSTGVPEEDEDESPEGEEEEEEEEDGDGADDAEDAANTAGLAARQLHAEQATTGNSMTFPAGELDSPTLASPTRPTL